MRMSKTLIICVALALATALTASLALASTPAPRTVKVGDNYFVRSTGVPKITVKRNTTVRFHFVGEEPHDVYGYRGSTSGTPKFHSADPKSSGYYKRKLTTTGTYTIVCELHGEDDQSMKIKVVTP